MLVQAATGPMTLRTWSLPWLSEFSFEIRELEAGWYWMLSRRGERVNGGLAASEQDALGDARMCAESERRGSYVIRPPDLGYTLRDL